MPTHANSFCDSVDFIKYYQLRLILFMEHSQFYVVVWLIVVHMAGHNNVLLTKFIFLR